MAKDTFLNRKTTLNCNGKMVDIAQPCVMGVINLTPDSFYGNSRMQTIDAALKQTEKFLSQGAKFIDLGAYSTRPGGANVSLAEELERLIPVVKAVCKQFPDALIAVDTFRANVAEQSVQAGACLINDIAAGNLDSNMFKTIAKLQVPYLIMHLKGTPQNMQNNAVYSNIIPEVMTYFTTKIAELSALGVKDIIIDPGFGFAKNLAQNYELLNGLQDFNALQVPVLVGFSRKSMIYKLLNTTPNEALNGTTVLNTVALLKGANILRVHDVKEAVECITLVQKMDGNVV